MLFSIGTKVRLIHTGDIGLVDHLMEHDLIGVLLPNGDIIPVIADALERAEEFSETSIKAKIVTGKKKPEPLPIPFPDNENQYIILHPQGVQLVFDPLVKTDGTTNEYRLYLINDTSQSFLFTLKVEISSAIVWETHGRLGSRMMLETGNIRHGELNNQPQVNIEIWRLLPEGQGTGGRLEKKIRIKPAQFFKKKAVAPYLNRSGHLYLVFNPKELVKQSEHLNQQPKESLESYTRRNQSSSSTSSGNNNLRQLSHEVEAMAAFEPEIDLHIDQLVDDPGIVPKKQILSTQVAYFEAYMRRAIWLGVNQVFIVHGVGEGKLKAAIAKQLKSMPEVKSFVNEYHPKYGYGATEVNL